MSKSSLSKITGPEKELTQMKYTDLKIACIVRGMLFEDVVEGTASSLQRFFIDNWHVKQDRDRLKQFDNWMAETLIKKGHDKASPLVKYRLSTVLDEQENQKLKGKSLKKAKVKKEKKEKRERDTNFNIFKGTKKAYTYELAQKGIEVGETVKLVIERFPEAQEKSIKIWYKRALKDAKDGAKKG
jgi:hypothetical protein